MFQPLSAPSPATSCARRLSAWACLGALVWLLAWAVGDDPLAGAVTEDRMLQACVDQPLDSSVDLDLPLPASDPLSLPRAYSLPPAVMPVAALTPPFSTRQARAPPPA